jgi:hypothetical protein
MTRFNKVFMFTDGSAARLRGVLVLRGESAPRDLCQDRATRYVAFVTRL